MTVPPSRCPTGALLSAVAALALLAAGGEANAVLSGLALAAVLVNAAGGRRIEVPVALGIAIGLSPGGLLLAPLTLGLAIRRGMARSLPLIPLAALAAWLATARWPGAAALPGLAGIARAQPQWSALIAAGGIGLAAWLAAAAGARPLAGRALAAAAALNIVGLACFVPADASTLLLPLIVAAHLHRHGIAVPLAANDNPPVPRRFAGTARRRMTPQIRSAALFG